MAIEVEKVVDRARRICRGGDERREVKVKVKNGSRVDRVEVSAAKNAKDAKI